MAFVSKQGGEELQDKASSGEPIDFDPEDPKVVKVHYDLAAWSFDHRAELAGALAEDGIAHYWDDDELVVPEVLESETDALFERLEAELGPFPVGLGDDDESVEYGLDEWSDSDRSTLTDSLVAAEIPHRWDDTTLNVAADAEEDVDALLDSIEAGELGSDDAEHEPPDGALSDIFLAADKLAKDPFDAKARRTLIDLDEVIDARHPPYALEPGTWKQAVAAVGAIVERVQADALGGDVEDHPVGDDGHLEESSDVIKLAQALRSVVRDSV